MEVLHLQDIIQDMEDNFNYKKFIAEGKLLKEEQMGSYGKFLKVVKSYEDEEILSDFLDSYPKGQDISKSEYERFTEKHLGLSDPEDYRGKNWKYIMSEGRLLKENMQDEDLLASQAIDILDEFRVYAESEELIQYLDKSMDYLERIPSNDDIYSAIQAVADGLNPYTGEEFDYTVDEMQSELERLIS